MFQICNPTKGSKTADTEAECYFSGLVIFASFWSRLPAKLAHYSAICTYLFYVPYPVFNIVKGLLIRDIVDQHDSLEKAESPSATRLTCLIQTTLGHLEPCLKSQQVH